MVTLCFSLFVFTVGLTWPASWGLGECQYEVEGKVRALDKQVLRKGVLPHSEAKCPHRGRAGQGWACLKDNGWCVVTVSPA